MNSEKESLLKVKDVAAILGLEEKAVYRMVKNNLIPHYVIGTRTIRFNADEIDKFLAARHREVETKV